MPNRDERSVLGGLSSSRPERIGGPRRAAPKRKPRPKAVRAASPPLKPHRPAQPPPEPIGAPRGTELVTTTIRAAGELTQIGFTVTGKILKRAVDRIPRP